MPAIPTAEEGDGEEALERLRSTDPPLYLTPSPELSRLARAASTHVFSSLLPFCPKSSPFDRLLAGDDFDAEQIWSQIDQLSGPIVSMLRRELKRLELEPPTFPTLDAPLAADGSGGAAGSDEEETDEDEDEEDAAAPASEDKVDDEEEDEEAALEEGDDKGSGVEDRFLKIKELEEYLERDEAKEYGHPEQIVRRKEADEEGEDEDGEEEGDEEDLEFGSFDGDEETDIGESARYEDFFGSRKKKGGGKNDSGKKENGSSKKVKFVDELKDSEMDEQEDDGSSKKVKFVDELKDSEMDEQEDDEDVEAQGKVLSTHEKKLQKIHSKIEQMEKENLESKFWTMQGEVTAAKRPKNSALEVDLDFEHNMRPAPVITEEVTVSLEDLIRKRIIEAHFDDVEKAPPLPSKAPKLLKELDENKSKKGLAEIYEEEYAQKTGLVSAPLSSSDEQKKEATILFKKICLKLDALSHFHFAPKPVIEDMSIQANVPALVMEEIAPLAVSDAAMLAPEEIFEGKGDIKEETELTKAERKRRRASKKRRFKAETAKKAAKRARISAAPGHPNGKENLSHTKSLREKNA